MTKANTTPANDNSTTITKKQRQLKVKQGFYEYQGRQQLQQRSSIAEILLKGKWLVDAGFDVDSNVDITIECGRLVITAV